MLPTVQEAYVVARHVFHPGANGTYHTARLHWTTAEVHAFFISALMGLS